MKTVSIVYEIGVVVDYFTQIKMNTC